MRFRGFHSSTVFSASKEPYKIVLTGGPCGGKSTALSKLSRFLNKANFKVFVLPEVATILLGAGVDFVGIGREQLKATQNSFLSTQIAIEDNLLAVSRYMSNRKTVFILDRGACDFSAYLPNDIWNEILKDRNITHSHLRDDRYDSVIHLVSAADGAEEYYQTENNLVRMESVEQAKEMDQKLLNAWNGHR